MDIVWSWKASQWKGKERRKGGGGKFIEAQSQNDTSWKQTQVQLASMPTFSLTPSSFTYNSLTHAVTRNHTHTNSLYMYRSM
jgi:hypothetical protein